MNKAKRQAIEDIKTGLAAMDAGNLEAAAQALEDAVTADRRNAIAQANLGIAYSKLEYFDEAASALCKALALKPDMLEAARPLTSLARRFDIDCAPALDARGLIAALRLPAIDRQPIVGLAFELLFYQPEFEDAKSLLFDNKMIEAARRHLLKRTAPILQNDLFLQALRVGKLSEPLFEKFATGLRYIILLEVPTERFVEDRKFAPLLMALAAQALENEHVWVVSPEERRALAELQIDRDKLVNGDVNEARKALIELLYKPLGAGSLKDLTVAEVKKIKPKAVSAFLAPLIEARNEEIRLLGEIPKFGTIVDETSRKVADMYEKSPYPRWTSEHRSPDGIMRKALRAFFNEDELAFMDEPYDVLIAGCGTGQQPAMAAPAYGQKASLLAFDISRPSLAYAKRMCAAQGIENVTFMQGDILEVDELGKTFDVIECIGVLHHMGDPLEGWRRLLDRLRPGGLMYIGLYSAIAREAIRNLRSEDGYPGPGCSDDEARAYRLTFAERLGNDPAADLQASADFNSLSNFRDLVLHESEQQFTLPEIADFLKENGLEFRGFTLDPYVLAEFARKFPNDPSPGSLTDWAAWEEERRHLFDGMYNFWCRKAE